MSRIYSYLKSLYSRMEKVKSVLEDYLEDYNLASSKEMKLVFFQDAIDHVSRYSKGYGHHLSQLLNP